MRNDVIRAGISCYRAETVNIRYFMREQRTIIEWQDWLRLRMPKLKAKTHSLTPSAIRLDDKVFADDLSIRYTNLLTYLCQLGDVQRLRSPDVETTYKWVAE